MAASRYTDLGTPAATTWSLGWFERVDHTESQLGHRICGAVARDGAPCTRSSTHASGRCPHHGGHHLTGAPDGNYNARLHGLYSRRLQVCGEHCPMWRACPFAEDDLLEIPLKKRPNCVYEQTEYDALIDHYHQRLKRELGEYRVHRNAAGTVNLSPTADEPEPEPPDIHLIHTVALLQVMVSRAAAALSVDTLTDTTRATGEHYAMESSKMSAALYAFLRLAREHRAYRRELMQDLVATQKEEAAQPRLGLADRVRPLLKKAEGVIEDAIAYEKRRQAAGKPRWPLIEEEDERFYEEHGFYPAIDEEWDHDPDEEWSSDKDQQDEQDEGTPQGTRQNGSVTQRSGESEEENEEAELNLRQEDQGDGSVGRPLPNAASDDARDSVHGKREPAVGNAPWRRGATHLLPECDRVRLGCVAGLEVRAPVWRRHATGPGRNGRPLGSP